MGLTRGRVCVCVVRVCFRVNPTLRVSGGAGSLLAQLLAVCGLGGELHALAERCEARGGAAAVSQARKIRDLATPVHILTDEPAGRRAVQPRSGAAPARLPPRDAVVLSAAVSVVPAAAVSAGAGDAEAAAVGQVLEILPDADAGFTLEHWPLQDIVVFLVVCTRINRPFVLPARLHCPHCCNTIARLLGHIRPSPPSTSLLYGIHHTILVITISCKG